MLGLNGLRSLFLGYCHFASLLEYQPIQWQIQGMFTDDGIVTILLPSDEDDGRASSCHGLLLRVWTEWKIGG